jgi:ankyrin repeat protein
VADQMLTHGAGRFTLIVASALGKVADVKSLLGSESDVVSTALYAAARNGHTGVVEYLLDHGAAIDTRGFFGGTGLHWAAINGHRNTVELLIARGASRSLRDEHFDSTPEEWAIEGGHTELATLLRQDQQPRI